MSVISQMKNVLIKREYDYALRICAYLAGKFSKGPVSLSQITKKLIIPKSFASKIVFQLRQSNLIGTVQGKYGGIFLKKDPQYISVMDILEAMDYNSTINECLVNPSICPLVNLCKIHRFFEEQEAIILNNFRQKKLSEFIIFEDDLAPNRSYAFK